MSLIRHRWLPPLLLVIATFLAFSSAFGAGFVWDDDQHITQNYNLRTARGLVKIWTDPAASPQFYPVAQTAYWLEYHAWGLHLMPWHIVNIAFHAANAVLVYLLLRRLAVPAPWLIALLFAVHPMQVETVAWVMELKNILSLFFFLWALWLFVSFWQLDRPSDGAPRNWRFYAAGLLLFAFALASKSVAGTLPGVLLVLLWFKRRRITRNDVALAVPLVAMAVAYGLFTAHLEVAHVGAHGDDWNFTLLDRFLIAGRALCFYPLKILWPHPLLFFYPRWNIDHTAWWQYLFPLAAASVLLAGWALRKRIGGAPITAFLLFAGVLFPALGFFNFYPMRYSFVANHFQYQACIPFFALVVGAALWALKKLPPSTARIAGIVSAAIVVSILASITFTRALVYKDAYTLYSDTVRQNENFWATQNLLGSECLKRNDPAEALLHYTRAAQLRPDIVENSLCVATADLALGRFEQARQVIESLLPAHADNAKVFNDLGNVYVRQQNIPEAERNYRHALELDPKNLQARYNLAYLLANSGRFGPAIEEFSAALKLRPDWPEAALFLARCLASNGSLQQALPWYQRAVELNPDWPEAQADLARTRAILQQSSLPSDPH